MNKTLPIWTDRVLHLALCVAAVVIVLFAATRWLSAGQAETRLNTVAARLAEQDADHADGKVPSEAETAADRNEGETPGGGEEAGPGNGRRRGGGSRGGDNQSTLPDDDPGLVAAKRINERFVFSSRPPQRFRNLRGVLGNAALFADGGAVEVGGSFDGAEVIEVGGDWVKLKYEGEEITVSVAGNGSAPQRAGGSQRSANRSGPRPGGEAGQRRGTRGGDRGGRFGGGADGGPRVIRLPAGAPQEIIDRIRERGGDNVEIIVGDGG